MSFINLIIPSHDKLKHFYLWTLFFLLTSILLIYFIDNDKAIGLAYGLTVFTAAMKEYKDSKNTNRNSEWLDFWFSILAPSLITLLMIILNI